MIPTRTSHKVDHINKKLVIKNYYDNGKVETEEYDIVSISEPTKDSSGYLYDVKVNKTK
jgi:hypothetical protein